MNIDLMNISGADLGNSFGTRFGAQTYYDILNVDQSATRLMIREAYLRLKNLYSSGGDALYGISSPDDLSRQLEDVEKAFEVLNDDTRRSTYDRELSTSSNTTTHQEWTTEAETWQPMPSANFADVIQTNRSTLRVTRTQASGANNQELQSKFLSAMEDGDIADGSMLVRLRELSGVNHAEIQERTKISLEYIRGMENNRFDRLPQVVYVKGFIRSYLKYLNVPNLEKIVSAYAGRLEAWQAGQK